MTLYILPIKWANTSGNHAGMYYLANMIKENSDIDVKIISISTKYLLFLNKIRLGFLYNIYCWLLSVWLKRVVTPNDAVLLMEYYLPQIDQSIIAKKLNGKCSVYGIAHLVPSILNKFYTTKQIQELSQYLNRLYVLGDSLRDYFISKELDPNQVVTTFHYVDSSFYRPSNELREENHVFQVICMGNMARNYKDLETIVERLPYINFAICSGTADLESRFGKFPNVKIIGYIEEYKLRELMQSSEISLNVMEDTIGSNVITTSLACGLVVVATNVGSISNYINNGVNGFLYDSVEDVVSIIDTLYHDRTKLRSISIKAREKAEDLDYMKFIDWLKSQIQTGQNERK